MIYLAFICWSFLILFMAVGVHVLWARLLRPAWVSWALLPGTLVSEMAYIFGTLITGGEVQRARLLPPTGRGSSAQSEPTTQISPAGKMFGSTVAALAATMACVGGIVVAWQLLGEPVIREFIVGWELPIAAVPTRLPLGEDAFWEMLRQQADLLRRMTHLWGEVDWLDWRTVLFVYLTVCFSLRLAPPKRDLRPALLAVLVIAGLIAAVEALRGNEMSGLWQLLTYLWTLLLWLLAVSLAITGVAVLIRVLAGKGPGGSTGRRSRRRTAAADEDE